jgi:hypothetical protein
MPIHDPTQIVLLAPERAPDAEAARLPRVRRKLQAILDEIEGAPRMPWDEAERGSCAILVEQMTRWLPDDEAQAIRHRFGTALQMLNRPAQNG